MCVCLLFVAGSGGPASRARCGAPHLFLWPLCLSALLGPLRAGVAPPSLAALAVPLCLGALLWLFFSAPHCLALRALMPRLCLLFGCWLLFGGFCPPPSLFVSRGFRRSFLVPWCCFFFFFFLPLLSLCAPVVSGFLWFPAPGALGLGAVRCLLCWPSASQLSVPLSLFRAFCLAGGCSPVVAAPPPPPLLSRAFRRCRSVLSAVCCVVLCVPGSGAAPRSCALCPPVLCRPVLCCARWVSLLVAPCPLALPVALGPCALRRCVLRCSPVLCVFCRGAVVRAVVRRSALCCVCPGVLCCAFPVLSALCGAVLRCAGALALCCSCGACCCWRLVLWCGAGSGGPWLSAGGVFRCRCPCLAAWSVSLWLVWFAVVPCFPVSCSVVLCCRAVLCCCALLPCCGAVGACFALLWAVVLCCVVLLVGCAVFCPVVVSACCGALFLVLCVPCLLRSVRCGALLRWLRCPASLCRVLWRCAVVWCCAVVPCCRFAVLFVFALPSCGPSCGMYVR